MISTTFSGSTIVAETKFVVALAVTILVVMQDAGIFGHRGSLCIIEDARVDNDSAIRGSIRNGAQI